MQRVFEALSSPVRRKILAYLSHADLTAGEIASRMRRSLPSRDFIAMRLAERRGDAVRFRHHALCLLKAEGELSEAERETRLAPLDTALYGRGTKRSVDLETIRKALFKSLWFRS